MAHEIAWLSRDAPFTERVKACCLAIGQPVVVPSAGEPDTLAAWILERRPAAVLIDLDAPIGDWRALAGTCKRSAALRRLPIVALSSEPESLRAEALLHGCDAVLERDDVERTLPVGLGAWLRRIDVEGLTRACAEPLSPAARAGIAHFNQAEYFEAHERLEEAWNGDPGPGRDLYRSLVQLAVAYLQIERGNRAGAVKILQRLWHWIEPLPDTCRGVDVAGVRADAQAVHQSLAVLDPEDMARFDRGLLRPIRVAAPGAE